jgi:hypothetical protein
MKDLGFEAAADIQSRDRMILSISGLEKCGKTHFGLTAPGPIAMFSTDIGEEGVVEKFRDKDVQLLTLDRVDDNAADQAVEEWERFRKAYYWSLKDGHFRTLLVDTATEIWEMLRMARFGRLTQVMPYQYGPVNAEYRALIRDAYKYDKNLILLHKMKAKYVNDKRTAEWERSGFSDTGFLVQVNAQVYRYDSGDFAIQVIDSRKNPDLMGEELVGPLCNFDFLAQLVNGG